MSEMHHDSPIQISLFDTDTFANSLVFHTLQESSSYSPNMHHQPNTSKALPPSLISDPTPMSLEPVYHNNNNNDSSSTGLSHLLSSRSASFESYSSFQTADRLSVDMPTSRLSVVSNDFDLSSVSNSSSPYSYSDYSEPTYTETTSSSGVADKGLFRNLNNMFSHSNPVPLNNNNNIAPLINPDNSHLQPMPFSMYEQQPARSQMYPEIDPLINLPYSFGFESALPNSLCSKPIAENNTTKSFRNSIHYQTVELDQQTSGFEFSPAELSLNSYVSHHAPIPPLSYCPTNQPVADTKYINSNCSHSNHAENNFHAVMDLPENSVSQRSSQSSCSSASSSLTPPTSSSLPPSLPSTTCVSTSTHTTTPASSSSSPSSSRKAKLDRNGRKQRIWTKRTYKCNHCELVFPHADLSEFASHISSLEKVHGVDKIGRKFKCLCHDCEWHHIGFVRKLEREKHFKRKHGNPDIQCRYWAGKGKEAFKGAKPCTTRWHTDCGNRRRHEIAVHGRPWTQDMEAEKKG